MWAVGAVVEDEGGKAGKKTDPEKKVSTGFWDSCFACFGPQHRAEDRERQSSIIGSFLFSHSPTWMTL